MYSGSNLNISFSEKPKLDNCETPIFSKESQNFDHSKFVKNANWDSLKLAKSTNLDSFSSQKFIKKVISEPQICTKIQNIGHFESTVYVGDTVKR